MSAGNSEELVLVKCNNSNTCKSYKYIRSTHPSKEKLQTILQNNYDCDKCEIVNSGMDAIFSIINGIHVCHKFPAINIIISDQMFSQTSKSIQYYCDTFAPLSNVIKVDLSDTESVLNTFSLYKDQFNIFYIESCSNPSGKIFDFDVIPKLKALSQQFYTIVDNTWLTEVIFNPFENHSDFVVLSCTKYYSAGNAILGAVLAKSGLDTCSVFSAIQNYRRLSGCHASPLNCDIVIKHISNIQSRINKSSQLTKEILQHLTTVGHPKLILTVHPYLDNHVSHNLLRYFKNELIPSVFLIGISLGKNQTMKRLKKCHIFDFKTSFGAKHSRFDPYCFAVNNVTYVRISLGYKDSKDTIVNGINEFLDQV
jgi:cystathionine beta-lyase/cystathionine gamma-synthase